LCPIVPGVPEKTSVGQKTPNCGCGVYLAGSLASRSKCESTIIQMAGGRVNETAG
jgi:hypothetical protein